MATITKKRLADGQIGGVPYGNVSALRFNLTTNATGAALDSNSAAAIGNGDKVIIGVLPAGFNLQDSTFVVSDAFTALVTANVGFEYVDGVDSAAVPQDADYFGAAVTLHTAGRYRQATTVRPVTLPKDAYLTIVTAGAANAAVGVLDVIVQGELLGAP